jgi:hypothetical protein
MSLLSSGYKKNKKKAKKGPYLYNSVKLKPGEKLWGLNMETEWLEEVDVWQVKQGGKTYNKKPNHIYVTAKTIELAQKKLNAQFKKLMKLHDKKKPAKMKVVE